MATKHDNDPSNPNAGRDLNRDPITGAKGSHPVATGVGAATAGAAGALIGSVVPGVGTVIGGVVGAIAGSVGGGYAGKAVGEMVDPTGDEQYWREHHQSTVGAKKDADFDRYRPAYQYGSSLADRSESAKLDEQAARSEWESNPDRNGLSYEEARAAIDGEFNRKIQLREEQLNVGKERVKTGDVNIRKEVTSETKTVEVPVEREEVVITHRAVAGPADGGTIGNEEIRIPVSEERVNISKNTVVTGEVEVGKRTVTDTKSVSDTVRKEDVKVDKTGGVVVDDRAKKA